MSDLLLKRLTPSEETDYGRFVKEHPHAMFYHSLSYLKCIAELTRARQETLLLVDRSGTMRGVLPALSKDGPFGRIINSLPFYGSIGGALASDGRAAAALIEGFNQLVAAPGVAGATIVGNPLVGEHAEENAHYTVTDSRIGQFTNLAPGEADPGDALMKSFHHKTRNMIRKGQKSGFTVRVDNDMIQFLRDVHQENIRALGGRPKPDAFFDAIARWFTPNDDFRIWVARRAGEPVAALLLFYFRGTVEYFTPVVREAHRSQQPLSLLIFDAMVDASRRGYQLWNWGGTWASQESLYLFKARWGTYDVKYTYYVQVNHEAIPRSTPDFLLAHYENFFVVPFHLLQTAS